MVKTASLPANSSSIIALDVEGMKCAGCVKAVEKQLQQNPGVISACVNLITEVAVVEYEPEQIQPATLAYKLTQTGFPSEIRPTGDRSISDKAEQAKDKRQQQQNQQFWQLITAAVLLIFSSIGHLHHLGLPSVPLLTNIWFHWALATLALLIPGRNLIIDGARSFYHQMPNMNSLVGLGTVSAYTASCFALFFPQLGWQCFFDEPVMLLGFIFLGRTLEARARYRASAALEKLVALQPSTARLVSNQANVSENPNLKIPVEQVRVGEWLRVFPGEKIPTDGTIMVGETKIDESMLTGESIAVQKVAGDRVFAGTINQEAAFAFQVTEIGNSTTLARIIELVESAQTRKAPVQQLADTVAGYFAYGVMAIATITGLFWYFIGTNLWPQVLMVSSGPMHQAMEMTNTLDANSSLISSTSPLLLSLQLVIAVLVIACPCALGLATPTAILVGTGMGAQQGILIKGGDILEQVQKLDKIVFDKTGTLTEGKLQVSAIEAINNLDSTSLLQMAAAVEAQSNHPLAIAIVNHAQQQELPLLTATDIQAKPGWGISGIIEGETILLGNQDWLNQHQITWPQEIQERVNALSATGQTIVYLAKSGELEGLIALRDQLRSDAQATVTKLQAMGLDTILLTGDREEIAQQIAAEVGISQVFAQVKPEDKAKIIQSLQGTLSPEQNLNRVAMIGDGINDAPALAQSDVGISLQASTDIAIETADIILMQNNLADVIEAIALSKATVQKIRQNLFWALGYNAIAIPLAAGVALPSYGLLLSPILAAIAMASSSLIVVTNSLLLKNYK
ncbi:heavy metal translocating P-type ATPase [Xenococcus sp. PCC 7305]|uniref:heavy metal translocating P-type ATPase n=1 Tax=Xenococcus sp. PCC 7305 TaxID=102125 RepID=UPI0002ABF508|nr:heavy metal translocating P-type ATPase [Xenococcus sp. PCC 7305]ELS05003.1 heavy metal translocating P-type ATPase [Xenococcus sp. PCC 7305]